MDEEWRKDLNEIERREQIKFEQETIREVIAKVRGEKCPKPGCYRCSPCRFKARK